MRQFELALTFAILFAVLWPATFGVRPRRGIAAGALIVTLIAQLQIEGYRWQMVPLYLLAVGLAVGDILFIDRDLKWGNRVARAFAGSAGVGILVLLPALLPVPVMPVPSGPEAIGTRSFQLIDASRQEVYGPSPGTPRTYMAQVWYPANPTEDDDPLPWSQDWDVVAPATATNIGFPSWTLNHTRYTTSNTYDKAPIIDGTFPVIIYSHGWTGFRTIAVNQIENLVSNGYIVFAPDHTYGSVATRFPSGEVITHDENALPDEEVVGEEAYRSAAAELISVFAADLGHVISSLEQGRDGPFGILAERADLTRIGVYGHSTGGGAAIQLCLTDERCDAVLGLDPWVEPLPDRIIRNSPVRPSLYMRSDPWRGTENDAVLRGLAGRSEDVTYWLGVEGAHHNDFVVTPLFSPLAASLDLKGPIATGRIIPIVDNYLLGFFDVFLLGTGPASLETVTFEEVSVELITP